MSATTVLAWHLLDGNDLRDGRAALADGELLTHYGDVTPYRSGVHASEDILDALQHAVGGTLCRVECGGNIVRRVDVIACSERRIVWRIDALPVLRAWTCWCALQCVSWLSVPRFVLDCLRDGRWEPVDVVEDAADISAWAAARDLSWSVQREQLLEMVEEAREGRTEWTWEVPA